jgi:hypothetical protein
MPGDLIARATGGLAKGPSFERLSIIPKDAPLSEAIKSPRKFPSSRFHVTERRELEKLPSLHGPDPPFPPSFPQTTGTGVCGLVWGLTRVY